MFRYSNRSILTGKTLLKKRHGNVNFIILHDGEEQKSRPVSFLGKGKLVKY